MYKRILKKVILFEIIFFSLLCFNSASAYCSKFRNISGEDLFVLEQFFRCLCVDSEAGYVLFGEKPVCILSLNHDHMPKNGHRFATILIAGLDVWRQYFEDATQKSYMLLYGLKKGQYTGLILINRQAFLDVVNKHLNLFQLILGQNVTAEGLLSEFVQNNKGMLEVTHDSTFLIGLLLGYGKANSFYESRLELLQRFCNQTSFPGFTTFRGEVESLENKLTISSEPLQSYAPRLIFAADATLEETQNLLKSYENTQSQIQQILHSDHFLEQILAKFVGDTDFLQEKKLKCSLYSFTTQEKQAMSKLVASKLWEHLEHSKEAILKAFLDGMQEADITSTLFLNPHTDDELFFAEQKWKAKQALQEAHAFFENLAKSEDYKPIIPQRLYFQMMKKGEGPRSISLNSSEILAHVVVSKQGEELINTYRLRQPSKLNLSETIPGFTQGILGMQMGEKRKLFIHPILGGEVCVNDGDYLIAEIELLEVQDSDRPSLASLLEEEWQEVMEMTEESYWRIRAHHFYNLGYVNWAFFKNHQELYTFEEIERHLKSFMQDEKPFDVNDPKIKELLHRLSWNTYQKLNQKEREESLKYFHSKHSQLIPLHKERLYYQKIQEGEGPELSSNDSPFVHYQIRDWMDRVIFDSKNPIKLDLKRAVRGFKEGLIGRKKGEKGILYIHPEWGYQDFLLTPYAGLFLKIDFEIGKDHVLLPESSDNKTVSPTVDSTEDFEELVQS